MEKQVNYEGDIRSLHDLGFDGVKFDSCGTQRNLTLYPCPTRTWCPFNMYRSSGDIDSSAQSWYRNLQSVIRFLQDPHCPSPPAGLIQTCLRSAVSKLPLRPEPEPRGIVHTLARG